MSCCTKCGVHKSRILTLIFLGVATATQAVAVALPMWSAIDTKYFSLPIKAFQNLWSETIIKDEASAFRKDLSKTHSAWKKDIQILEVSCIATGLLSLFLLLLSSVTHKVAPLSKVCHILGIFFNVVAGSEILAGSLLYNKKHTEIFSVTARDPQYNYPMDKLKLSYGFFVSVSAGAIYVLVAIIEISVWIADYVKMKKSSEILAGSLLYNKKHTEIFSVTARDPQYNYPMDKLKLSYGFFVSVSAGAIYVLVAIFEISVRIADYVKMKKSTTVQSFH